MFTSLRQKLKHTDSAPRVWRLHIDVCRFDPWNIETNEWRNFAGLEYANESGRESLPPFKYETRVRFSQTSVVIADTLYVSIDRVLNLHCKRIGELVVRPRHLAGNALRLLSDEGRSLGGGHLLISPGGLGA